jgi:G3E family GTPase
MDDDTELCSLGEVYELERIMRGLDPDEPIMICRKRCSHAILQARKTSQAVSSHHHHHRHHHHHHRHHHHEIPGLVRLDVSR